MQLMQNEDIKQIIQSLNTLEGMNGIFLHLDEIQNFNKKQQQRCLNTLKLGRLP